MMPFISPFFQRISSTAKNLSPVKSTGSYLLRHKHRIQWQQSLFSSQYTGKVLSGLDIAKDIRVSLTNQVEHMKIQYSGLTPHLTIVQVGSREDSNVYVRMKLKAAENIGIKTTHIHLPSSTNQTALLRIINCLNVDTEVHGVIVQMPLDSVERINATLITDSVSSSKDVDGLHTVNQGKLAVGDLTTGFIPCTPNGCLELIKRSGIRIEGSYSVVVGRSKIVGTPVSEILKWHDATVTTCHKKTSDLAKLVSHADILVVGAGHPHLIKGEWIKQGAVVIDVGINSVPDPTKKSGFRLVGDVDFEEARKRASWITPVPGGVGPMTVAMLMKNTVLAAFKTRNHQSEHQMC